MEEIGKKKTYLKTGLLVLLSAFAGALITLAGLAFYVYQFNPFNVQVCLITSFLPPTASNESATSSPEVATPVTNHPLLSAQQEAMLESAGVDVSTLPSTITPELRACFVAKLGEARVAEILAGAELSLMDTLKGSPCLK